MEFEFFETVGTATGTSGSGTLSQQLFKTAYGPAPIPAFPVSAWAKGDGIYWGISESVQRLGAGCYKANISPAIGVYLQEHTIHTDTILRLPDSKSDLIVKEIEHFTTLRPEFEKRGYLYKRGILLWGPPGSGKTCTLYILIQLIVGQMGGIALLVDSPDIAAQALRLVRKIEPERQIICIIEDLDVMVQSYGPSNYLALLDGESQVGNVVFVATTNYPEHLDRRFVDRPSRFDTVEYVGMPTSEARRFYITTKEPTLDVAVVEEMVSVSDGLSVAHLRELIILTQCFGKSVEDAGKRLNASRHRLPSSLKAPGALSAGFGG